MMAVRPLLVTAGGAGVVNMTSHLGHLSLINGNIYGGKELIEDSFGKPGNYGGTIGHTHGRVYYFIVAAEAESCTNQGIEDIPICISISISQ